MYIVSSVVPSIQQNKHDVRCVCVSVRFVPNSQHISVAHKHSTEVKSSLHFPFSHQKVCCLRLCLCICFVQCFPCRYFVWLRGQAKPNEKQSKTIDDDDDDDQPYECSLKVLHTIFIHKYYKLIVQFIIPVLYSS